MSELARKLRRLAESGQPVTLPAESVKQLAVVIDKLDELIAWARSFLKEGIKPGRRPK